MTKPDKTALKAAETIREYCQSIVSDVDGYVCVGCIFDEHGCILNDPNHLPETWELERIGKERNE